MFIKKLSPSKSSTYEQCQLLYKYRYVEFLAEDEGGNKDAMKFGSYIHRIFELCYEETENKDKLYEVADEIAGNYEFQEKIDEKRKNKCIDNFFNFNKTLEETVGVELEYEVEVQEGIFLSGS